MASSLSPSAQDEIELRFSLGTFIVAWDRLRDTSAANRSDFPLLPPLPASRLRATYQQHREVSVARSALKAAEKALHTAAAQCLEAPAPLRLALNDFLASWDLLSGLGGPDVAIRLQLARRRLKVAFTEFAFPIDASDYYASLGASRSLDYDDIPDDDTDDLDGVMSRASRL